MKVRTILLILALLSCLSTSIGGALYYSALKKVSDPLIREAGLIILVLCALIGLSVSYLYKKASYDIIQRKKAEKELKELAERFQQVAENASEWIWEVNAQGLYTYASPVVKKIFGYQPEEIVGKKHFYDLFHPEDREQLKNAAFEVFAGKEPFREFINRNIHKSGKQIWLSTSGVPVLDNEGNLAGYRGVDTNITKRKHSEEELWKSEEKYRLLVQNLPSIVYKGYKDWSVEFFDEKLTLFVGYDADVFNSKRMKWIDIIIQEDIDTAKESFIQALKTDKSYVREYRIKSKSGEIYWIQERGQIVCDEKGEIEHVNGVFFDITDRKRLEEKLRQALAKLAESNAELEQFAYIAAHDLKEPLRMVTSYLQLLTRRYQGKLDTDADEFIAYAVDGATRMKTLINDLLFYSRMGSRGKPFEPSGCEAALDQALTNLKVAIEESGAVVTRNPLPEVPADEGQLVQLFQNLIENAIKFRGEESPIIHISANHTKQPEIQNRYVFSVSDNGIGIDPEYADRIFLIFKRLHGREHPGTGIGLAVCKRIVKRHGGRIWVESEVGKGSTFFFTLPGDRMKNS